MEAVQRGFVGDVIDPATTRRRLCEDLELFKKSQRSFKKHGSIPLNQKARPSS